MRLRPIAVGIGLLDSIILSGLAFAGPPAVAGATFVTLLVLSGLLSAIGLPLILVVVSHIGQIPGVSDLAVRVTKWLVVAGFVVPCGVHLLAKDHSKLLSIDRLEMRYLLFLLWAAVCSFFALAPVNSFTEVLRLAMMVPVYYVTRILCTSRRHLLLLALGFALAVTAASLASYYQLQTEGLIRVRGMFQNPNMLGVFLTFALPGVAVGLIVTRSRLLRLLLAGVLVIGFFSLILSWSRSCYFSLGIQVLVYAILEKHRRVLAACAAIAVVLVVVMFAVPELGRVGFDALRLKGGTTHRTILWEKGLAAFIENPVFGVGFDAPREEVAGRIMWNDFVEHMLYSDPKARFAPHNLYIYVLMSTGAVGMLLFAGLYRSAIVGQVGLRRSANDDKRRRIHTVVLAMLCGTLGYAFFESHAFLGHGSWSVYFWILMGMANSPAIAAINEEEAAIV